MRPLRLSRMAGLTLVELMIAMTLGLLVIGALAAVFVSNNQNYRQNEAIATVQDNARFALDALSRDLAMAGYWGGVRPIDAGVNVRVSVAARSSVAKAAVGDCGPATQASDYFWLFDVGVPIVFRNGAAATTGMNTDFTCLDPADMQPNSDVLAIRRVSGAPLFQVDGSNARTPSTAELTTGRFYVKTNQNIASLFRASGAFSLAAPTDCPDNTGINEVCKPTDNPVQIYAYTPQIYYVRNFRITRGDGIPMLCRRWLNDTLATPVMEEDCLADGVESLQIEWGLASGKQLAGYTSTPTADQLFNARTARIHVLVRAPDQNVQASDATKTFNLADLSNFSPTPTTGVLRRAYTTTVQLKNLATEQ